MAVTIKDVAKRAAVSITTVSKVINNYTGVSSSTKQKVLEIVEEMGYQPNSNARSLITRNTRSIGIFFKDHFNTGLRHPFFHDVIHGFKQAIGEQGFDIVFFANTKWGHTFSYTERSKNRNVDGVLMMGVPNSDPYLQELLESEIPTMFIDLNLVGKKAGYVVSENAKGAESAIDHLFQLGHQRIATVIGTEVTYPTQERLQGYINGLNNHGLDFDSELIAAGNFTKKGGYQAFKNLMKLDPPPTAIFYQGDMMAIGGLEAAREMGIDIPGDVSVIGFDDIDIASLVSPSLTTVSQDKYQIGQIAASSLLKMVKQKKTFSPVKILPTTLKVRNSTGVLNKRL